MSLIVTLYLTLKSPAIPIKEFTGKSQS